MDIEESYPLNEVQATQFTQHADIDKLLDSLLREIRGILGPRLVGLYLYGSLVTSDFDRGSSDIDLLAATSSDIDENKFEQLQEMHVDFTNRNREWDGRMEIAYLSVEALRTFKSHASKIAIISPGEPFHIKEAGKDWLMNWYIVRERGVTLFGPPPGILIDQITKEEFIQAVTDYARAIRERIAHTHSRPAQAYAILTMCRALYAYKNGEQASKKQAALWAQKELPEWSSLIQDALSWREAWRDEQIDHAATFPETVRFVRFIVDQFDQDYERHSI